MEETQKSLEPNENRSTIYKSPWDNATVLIAKREVYSPEWTHTHTGGGGGERDC